MEKTVETYERVMWEEYDDPAKSPKEKAKYLLDLFTLRTADKMGANEVSALERVFCRAFTPQKPDGSNDYDALEELNNAIADVRLELAEEAGRAWQQFNSTGDTAEQNRAIDLSFMESAHQQMMAFGIDVLGVPTELRNRVESFEQGYPDYIEQRTQEHPEETWHAYSKGQTFELSSYLHQSMIRYTEQKAAALPEDRKAVYDTASQIKLPKGTEFRNYMDRALHTTLSAPSEAYRSKMGVGPIVKDFESIYEPAVMEQWISALAQLPIVKNDAALIRKIGLKTRSVHSAANEASKYHFYTTGEGYQEDKTLSVIREKDRREIREFVLDISDRLAELPEEQLKAELGEYQKLRQTANVETLIQTQPGMNILPRITERENVDRFDQLYYKMLNEDGLDPDQEESKEYKAMFSALEAIHKASPGYDYGDVAARAQMSELMAQANKAANVYAEKEVYGKTGDSQQEVSRKNSALMLLDLTTNSGEPDWSRVTDFRMEFGKQELSKEGLYNRLKTSLGHNYVSRGKQERRAADQEAIERETEKYHHDLEQRAAARRMTRGIEKMTNTNPETRDTYFGFDVRLLEAPGTDEEKKQNLTKEQQQMYDDIQAVKRTGDEAGELMRGGCGGLTALSSAVFMARNPKVPFQQVMDPNALRDKKQEAAKEVLQALKEANGNPRNMKKLGNLVGESIKAMTERDMRKDALDFLGRKEDLSPEQARAVFRDPQNREKLITFVSAYNSFIVQDYQALQRPGLVGLTGRFSFPSYKKETPREELTASLVNLQDANITAEKKQELMSTLDPFVDAVLEKTGEDVMKAFANVTYNGHAVAGGRMMKDYIDGTNREMKPERLVQGSARLAAMLDVLAEGALLSDHRLIKASQEIHTIPEDDPLFAAKPEDFEKYIYKGLDEDRLWIVRAKVAPIAAKPVDAKEAEKANREAFFAPIVNCVGKERWDQYLNELEGVEAYTGVNMLKRTSPAAHFYMYLFAKTDHSAEEILNLESMDKDKVKGYLDDFVAATHSLQGKSEEEKAAWFGSLQGGTYQKLAAFRYPDEALPANLGDKGKLLQTIGNICIDSSQDLTLYTRLDGGEKKAFAPEFFAAAGGYTEYERISNAVLPFGQFMKPLVDQLNAQLVPAEQDGPKAHTLVGKADARYILGHLWDEVRGKTLSETPFYTTELSMNYLIQQMDPNPLISDLQAQAKALKYLTEGGELPWAADTDRRIQKRFQLELGDRIKHSYRSLEEINTSDWIGFADDAALRGITDMSQLPREQRNALNEAFHESFGAFFHDDVAELLTRMNKTPYDAILIDGRTATELYGAKYANLSPAERDFAMRAEIVHAATDPDHKIGIADISLNEQKQPVMGPAKQMMHFASEQKELKLPAKDGLDYAKFAAEFRRSPGIVSEEMRSFTFPGNESRVFKDIENRLEGTGKEKWDYIFVNGKSINEMYREQVVPGLAGKSITDVQERQIKSAMLTAWCMDPTAAVGCTPITLRNGVPESAVAVPIVFSKDSTGVPEEVRTARQNAKLISVDRTERRLTGMQVPGKHLNGGMDDVLLVHSFDDLYHKMKDQDTSGPLHRDSDEYKAMFTAVEKIHEAATGFNPMVQKDWDDMKALVSAAKQAAEKYAEKEVYGKTKSSGTGMNRKNSAVQILWLATNGKEPDAQHTVDLRTDSKKAPCADVKELVSGQIRENTAAYGALAAAERGKAVKPVTDALAAEYSERKEHRKYAFRIKREADAFSLKSSENVRTFLGIDPSLVDGSDFVKDVDSKVAAGSLEQTMVHRIQRFQLLGNSKSETLRSNFGGIRSMAILRMLQKDPNASFADLMDPNKMIEQKREAANEVIEAIEKANGLGGHAKNMDPLATMIADGVRTLSSLDVKKQAISYLGLKADCTVDEAKAAFQDPKNREKMILFTNAVQGFMIGAYQELQMPPLKGTRMKGLNYESLDLNERNEKGRILAVIGQYDQTIDSFAGLMQEKLTQEDLVRYRDMKQNAHAFAVGGDFVKWMTAEAGWKDLKAEQVAQASVKFAALLDRIAEGTPVSDLRYMADDQSAVKQGLDAGSLFAASNPMELLHIAPDAQHLAQIRGHVANGRQESLNAEVSRRTSDMTLDQGKIEKRDKLVKKYQDEMAKPPKSAGSEFYDQHVLKNPEQCSSMFGMDNESFDQEGLKSGARNPDPEDAELTAFIDGLKLIQNRLKNRNGKATETLSTQERESIESKKKMDRKTLSQTELDEIDFCKCSSEVQRGGFGGIRTFTVLALMDEMEKANTPITLAQALDPNAFVAQKQRLSKHVVQAINKANAKDPQVSDLANIIGNGIRTLSQMNPKKELLTYLGKDADLDPEQTKEEFRKPENREKILGYLSMHSDFYVQASQILQNPGMTTQYVYWGRLDLRHRNGDTGKFDADACAELMSTGQSQPWMNGFINEVIETAGPEAMKAYKNFATNQKAFAFCGPMLSYYDQKAQQAAGVPVTGQPAVSSPEEAIKLQARLDLCLEHIAESTSIADPRINDHAFKVIGQGAIVSAVLGVETKDVAQIMEGEFSKEQRNCLHTVLPDAVKAWETKNPEVAVAEAENVLATQDPPAWYKSMSELEQDPRIANRLDAMRRQPVDGTNVAEANRSSEQVNQVIRPENDLSAIREMLNMRVTGANRQDTQEYRHMSEMELSGLGTVMEKGLIDVRNGMRENRAKIAGQEAGSRSRVYLDLLQDMQQMMLTEATEQLDRDAALRARGYSNLIDVKASDSFETKAFNRNYAIFATMRGSMLTDGISDLGMAIDRLITQGGANLHVDDQLKTDLAECKGPNTYQDIYFRARGDAAAELDAAMAQPADAHGTPAKMTILVSPTMEEFLQKAIAADPQKYASFANMSMKDVLAEDTITANLGNAAAERRIPEKMDFVITDRQSIRQDDFAAFMSGDMRQQVGQYRQAFDALTGKEDWVGTLAAKGWDADSANEVEAGLDQAFADVAKAREVIGQAGRMHRAAEFGSRMFKENILPQFTAQEQKDLADVDMDLTDAIMIGGQSLKSYVGEKYNGLPAPLKEDMLKAELANVVMNTDLQVSVAHFTMQTTANGLKVPQVSEITSMSRNVQKAFHTPEANDALEDRQQRANTQEALAEGRNMARTALEHPRTARIRMDLEAAKTLEDLQRIVSGCKAAEPEEFANHGVQDLDFGSQMVSHGGRPVRAFDPADSQSGLAVNKERILAFCDAIDEMPPEFSTVKGFAARYNAARQEHAALYVTVNEDQLDALRKINDQLNSKESGHWYHQDSDEYKAMKGALSAFCEKTAKLDLADPAQNARISALMDDVYKAAETYAKKNGTGSPKTDMGAERLNQAGQIMQQISRDDGAGLATEKGLDRALLSAEERATLRDLDQLEKEIKTYYGQERFKMSLTPTVRDRCIENYLDVLDGVKGTVGTDTIDWKLADFKQNALENGWSPEDMDLLETVFRTAQRDTDRVHKSLSDAIIANVTEYRVDTLSEKSDFLELMESYAEMQAEKSPKLAAGLHDMINNSLYRQYAPTEFPEDKVFQESMRTAGITSAFYVADDKSDPMRKRMLEMMGERGLQHNRRSDAEKQKIRNKGDYILPELSDEELETHRLNKSQKHGKVQHRNREVMKDIFGEDVYDGLDEMYKGTETDRTIPIHHSLGNKQLDAGERVFEIDFAGSGFSEARREYHGSHGKDAKEGDGSLDEMLDAQYGERIHQIGDMQLPKDSYYRMKTTRRDDGREKKRLNIPGPSPKTKVGGGMLDAGDYSIEKNQAVAMAAVKDFLNPLIEEYKAHKDDANYHMAPVRLSITGHSRGGVAAGLTVKEVDQWLKSQPGLEEFAKNVHIDLLQRDPVPGPDNSSKEIDLRDVRNLNASTIYTTAADNNASFFFTPQKVRGQKKMIIGTTPHSAGLEGADLSQLNVKGDEKAHQFGFLDASTQEYYRGSGIAELPDGMYFSDEKRNLLRVDSYSQLGKLIEGMGQSSFRKQDWRIEQLHQAVRDWFVDNDLTMSFATEEKRAETEKKVGEIGTKVMGIKVNDTDMAEVQQKVQAYQTAFAIPSKPQTAEQKEATANLIEACRSYMKNTEVPAKNAVVREEMEMVSDLLSGVQRLNNYREKGLNAHLSKEQQDKIRQKNDAREGTLDRQYDRENDRLITRAAGAKNTALVFREECKGLLERLNQTKKKSLFGFGNSDSYEKLHKALEAATKLSGEDSVDKIRETMENVQKCGKAYDEAHDNARSAIRADGVERRKVSQEAAALANGGLERFDEQTRYVRDRSQSLDEIIVAKADRVQDLDQRRNAPDAPEAPKKEGLEFLASLKGVDPAALSGEEQFHAVLDSVYINGMSAVTYFKAAAPDLPLTPASAEEIGNRLKAIVDAAKTNPAAATFVGVEDAKGMLHTVKVQGAPEDANVARYNRIADMMHEDLNKTRQAAIDSYSREAEQPEVHTDEDLRNKAMVTAVRENEGEGLRRKKVGLAGLMAEADGRAKEKKDYAALRAAKNGPANQQQAQHGKGGPHS